MSEHQSQRQAAEAQEDGQNGALLDADEAAEEVPEDVDAQMDSGESGDEGMDEHDEEQVINLENDSVAYFPEHNDSIYCIAQHPTRPEIVVTGGGDDVAYVFDSTPPERPVLPTSYQSAPAGLQDRSLKSLARLEGHTDSVNAVVFTLPRGEYVVTGGLDGRLRTYRDTSPNGDGRSWTFVGEVQEVDEIGWLAACPHPQHPNTVAFGAQDGSVWVYKIHDEGKGQSHLGIVRVDYLHTQTCTAGAWTEDGKLLATVSEDSSLIVLDVFGEEDPTGAASGQAVVSLTAQDQRFAVDGGLFSVAIAPHGMYVAVGGAGGHVRVVSLPKEGGVGSKAGSSKSQAGQILASIQAQAESIETLAFSRPTSSAPASSLLAAGSVDGSIAIFEPSRYYAVRRHIQNAHSGHAVVKLDFVKKAAQLTGGASASLLTSAGIDGVVRQWDVRGGAAAGANPASAAPAQGLVREFKGHRGGEGAGILAFVQDAEGKIIVTAGDE